MLSITGPFPETLWGVVAHGPADQIDLLMHLLRKTGVVDVDVPTQLFIKAPHLMKPHGVMWELIQIKLETGDVPSLQPDPHRFMRSYLTRRRQLLQRAHEARITWAADGGIHVTVPAEQSYVQAVALMDLYESVRPAESPQLVWNGRKPKYLIAGLPVPDLHDAAATVRTVEILQEWMPSNRTPGQVRSDGRRGTIEARAYYGAIGELMSDLLAKVGVQCDREKGQLTRIVLSTEDWQTVRCSPTYHEMLVSSAYTGHPADWGQRTVDAFLTAALAPAIRQSGETVTIDLNTLASQFALKYRGSKRQFNLVLPRPMMRLMTIIFHALRPAGAPYPIYDPVADEIRLIYQAPKKLSHAGVKRLVRRTNEWLPGRRLYA